MAIINRLTEDELQRLLCTLDWERHQGPGVKADEAARDFAAVATELRNRRAATLARKRYFAARAG